MSKPDSNELPRVKHGLLIIGPAFLAACLLEALVFAMVDPGEVHWPGHTSQPSRQGIYTMAFFSFWLISMACGGLVLWLAKPDQENESKISGKPGDSRCA